MPLLQSSCRSSRNATPNALGAVKRLSMALTALLAIGSAGAGAPVLRLNSADLETSTPAMQLGRTAINASQLIARPDSVSKRLHIVQFQGPVQASWYAALEQTGVQIVDFVPDFAYLVYADAQSFVALQQMVRSLPADPSRNTADLAVQWDGEFDSRLKIDRQIYALESKGLRPDFYGVQLVGDATANAATLGLLQQISGSDLRTWTHRHYLNVEVKAPFGALSQIAARSDVLSIQAGFNPELHDERQNTILANRLTNSGTNTVPIAPTEPGGIAYLDWLAERGFTQAQFDASNFTVDVSDSGLDNGTQQPNHFALWKAGDPGTPVDPLRSLVTYNKREGTAAAADLTGCGGVGHGTWTSHTVSGNVASQARTFPHGDGNFHFGGGVAPFVRVGNSVFFSNAGGFTNPNFANTISNSYSNAGTNIGGARIGNNSWGAAVSGAYNADAQAYDALVRDAQPAGSSFPADGSQQIVLMFSAGNSGPGATTIGAPGTGKNVITVGGSQNVRPGVGDAVNADAMYNSSSRGPTADGRNKPDIIAPATNIAGGVVMADRLTAAPGNNNTCFTGGFLPTTPVQQRFYRTGNGTSFSGPAVAGGGALLRQWFINQGWDVPSPAMTKAWLSNSASFMSVLTDNLPSNNQGMGRMNLERAFDAVPRTRRDQLTEDRFSATGQLRSFRGTISDSTKPMRISLAWTDAPGPTTGATLVNNLDLRVSVGGTTYLGNRFTQGASVAGGNADVRNNLESVFLPAGVSGNFNVTVLASNVALAADPSVAGLNQDFALLAYNAGDLVGCPAFAITPETLPSNVVGGVVFPAQNFSASGGSGGYSFSASGSLPPGLSLSSQGVLSGTPTAPGTFSFGVTASDSQGCADAKPFSITVISAEVGVQNRSVATGNAIIEPNECNDLNITLRNSGTNPATAISAVLSTTTPGVSIAQANSAYPDLGIPGGVGVNQTAFQISTDSSVSCGSIINVTQTLTLTGGGSPTLLNLQIPVGQQGTAYEFTPDAASAVIPAGGTLIPGSNVDDVAFATVLPFALNVYGRPLAAGSSVQVSTNGNIQLQSTAGSTATANAAMPVSVFGATTAVLMPFWDDLDLRTTGGGIYTQTIGAAPNREFIVEWRGKHFDEAGATQTVQLAVVFKESEPSNFEYRYVQVGALASIAGGASATIGLQNANAGTVFTQFSFNQASVVAGRVLQGRLPAPICSAGTSVCASDVQFKNGFE